MSTRIQWTKDERGNWLGQGVSSPGHGRSLVDADPVGPELRRPGWDGVCCPKCSRTHWIAGLGVLWTCPDCGTPHYTAEVCGLLDCEGVDVAPVPIMHLESSNVLFTSSAEFYRRHPRVP